MIASWIDSSFKLALSPSFFTSDGWLERFCLSTRSRERKKNHWPASERSSGVTTFWMDVMND